MKMIVAVIKPFKLADVRDGLTKIDLHGMTVSDVKGFGRQKGQVQSSGEDTTVPFLPKVKLEIVVPDEREDEVVETIVNAAHTGRIGDGKIFVRPVDKVVRIRTGETGEAAV